MLTGKTLSILGDSISTYKGVSNDAFANSTLIHNEYRYESPMPLEKTWWHILMHSMDLVLCVNNSFSGAPLSGSHSSSGVKRAENLSRDDGTDPDIVIIFMGINDLGRGIDPDTFYSDYEKTLFILKEKYPGSRVCCVNIPDRDIRLKRRAEIFNEKIAAAVKSAGNRFFIADLFGSRMSGDFYYSNTVDGLHPDEDGMSIIAEIIENSIRKNCSKI